MHAWAGRVHRRFNNTSSFDELPVYRDLLAATLERLSRDQFVKALQKAGFEGQSNSWKAGAEVPAEIKTDLSELNFGSQINALRQLH